MFAGKFLYIQYLFITFAYHIYLCYCLYLNLYVVLFLFNQKSKLLKYIQQKVFIVPFLYWVHVSHKHLRYESSAYIEPRNIFASQGYKLMLEKLLVGLEHRILGK